MIVVLQNGISVEVPIDIEHEGVQAVEEYVAERAGPKQSPTDTEEV